MFYCNFNQLILKKYFDFRGILNFHLQTGSGYDFFKILSGRKSRIRIRNPALDYRIVRRRNFTDNLFPSLPNRDLFAGPRAVGSKRNLPHTA